MQHLGWLFLILAFGAVAQGKFERPSESERLQALGNLSEETDTLRILLTPNDDFPPVKLPGPGD